MNYIEADFISVICNVPFIFYFYNLERTCIISNPITNLELRFNLISRLLFTLLFKPNKSFICHHIINNIINNVFRFQLIPYPFPYHLILGLFKFWKDTLKSFSYFFVGICKIIKIKLFLASLNSIFIFLFVVFHICMLI